MYGGRSFILHDSFIYEAWDHLAEYLSQIGYLHWSAFSDSRLQDAVKHSDVIVVQTVQRELVNRMDAMFKDDRLAGALP